jgi:hypothetical protein
LRASEAIFVNRHRLVATLSLPSRDPPSAAVDCFDGSDRPQTARKAGVVAAPGERSPHARQRAEKSGGATEKRQKPPKNAFDFGRSKAGSDALIAGPQSPSAPNRFLKTAENP